jgi:hypothetical protein
MRLALPSDWCWPCSRCTPCLTALHLSLRPAAERPLLAVPTFAHRAPMRQVQAAQERAFGYLLRKSVTAIAKQAKSDSSRHAAPPTAHQLRLATPCRAAAAGWPPNCTPHMCFSHTTTACPVHRSLLPSGCLRARAGISQLLLLLC